MSRPLKFVVCGESRSDNLGDVLIAESLNQMLKSEFPDADVSSVDISGRSSSVDISDPASGSLAEIARRLHRCAYARLGPYARVANLQHARKLKRYFKELCKPGGELAGAELVLVGGGQLLQDNSLAFPLFLHSLVGCLSQIKVPMAFFSVGVGRHWSKKGKRLMREVLETDCVISVVCRDELSLQRAREQFPNAAEKLYSTVDCVLGIDWKAKRMVPNPNSIGVCVVHPLKLRSFNIQTEFGDEDKAPLLWIALCTALLETGWSPVLFTNGARADDEFMRDLHCSMPEPVRASVSCAQRALSSAELLETISRFSSIISHRLHANVVATVLGVPSVALEWDDKVREFMRYTGRIDSFVEATGTVEEILSAVNSATIHQPDILVARLRRVVRDDLRNVVSLARHKGTKF